MKLSRVGIDLAKNVFQEYKQNKRYIHTRIKVPNISSHRKFNRNSGQTGQILCSYLNFDRIQPCFLPTPEPGTRSTIPLPKWEQQIGVAIEFISSVE